MGEQQFQQMFDDLVRQKQDEKNEELREQFGEAYRTQHQAPGQQINDRQAEIIHHQEELKYYKALADKDGTEFDRMQPFAQGQSLVPAVKSDGLSNKRKEKLRTRTRKELEKGRQIVGEYGTAQTIPLMRSLRKNGEALRKQREKQKEDEKADIIALSDMVIPADLFEFEITEKHSHFDVKRALRIKDELDRIANYKAKTDKTEYFLLPEDVQVKLEVLLNYKPIFERTLNVALAANGVSVSGEKLKEDEIKDARREYYGVTEAFKGVTAAYPFTLREYKAEKRESLKAKQTYQSRFLREKNAIRDRILGNWDKYKPVEKTDPVTGEKTIVGDPSWVEIPGEVDKTAAYYTRSVYRLVSGDDEASEQKSYQAIKMMVLADRLANKENAPDNPELKTLKDLAIPYYNEFREKADSMLDSIRGCSLVDLIDRYEELVNFEIGWQSMSDVMKVQEGKTALKDTLGMSVYETEKLRTTMMYISYTRKAVDSLMTLRRLRNGEELDTKTELSENLDRALSIVKGGVRTEKLRPDDLERVEKLEKDLKRDVEVMNQQEQELTRLLSGRRDEIRTQIKKDTEIERTSDGDQQVLMEEYLEAQQEVARVNEIVSEAIPQKMNVRPVDELKKKFMASNWKANGLDGIDEGLRKKKAFEEFCRELYGNKEITKGGIIEINEGEIAFDDVMALFQTDEETGETTISSDAVVKLLDGLIKFDPKKEIKELEKIRGKSMKERILYSAKTLGRLHYLTTLSQWSDRMDLSFLSDYWQDKIEKQGNAFTIVTILISNLQVPAMTEKCIFDREIENALKEIDDLDRIEGVTKSHRSAKEEFSKKHVAVLYDRQRIVKLGLSDNAALYGDKREESCELPIAEDEMAKIEIADEQFMKALASEIADFSLLTKEGRKRLLFDDTIKELESYGKEDLLYYSELNRTAVMLTMAYKNNPKLVKEAIGEGAEKVLEKCKEITAIFKSLHNRMKEPLQTLTIMRDEFSQNCGRSVEEEKASREDLHDRFADAWVAKSTVWTTGLPA